MIKNITQYLSELGYTVLNIYPYGSRVYGTHQPSSDYDYIVVIKSQTVTKIDGVEFVLNDCLINLTIYSEQTFAEQIEAHEISCLECLFLDKSNIFETVPFKFKLNLQKMRVSISSKCSNSWSVCNKKLTVENDIKRSLKSLFHVFRIYNFAIQIIENNSIKFDSINVLYFELFQIPLELLTWDYLKANYQSKRNSIATEFKKLASL